MRRPGRAEVILAVAASVAVAGLGVALRPQHTPVNAVVPSTVEIQRPELEPSSNRPTALVISDSYTSGDGLAETSYACAAATRMGWLCKLAAEPGTGYISGGTANRFPIDQGTGESTAFGERIPILAGMYRPDIVILDGGRNDTFVPPDDRFAVTASTIWQAHQTWPAARIVYVVPRFLARPDDDLGVGDDIADRLKEASGVKDLVVVDPIAGLKDSDTGRMISADGTNPNLDGERSLAAALGRALKTSRIPPAT